MPGRVKPRPPQRTVPNANSGEELRADFDTTDGGFFRPDTDDYFEPLNPDGQTLNLGKGGVFQRPNWDSSFVTNPAGEEDESFDQFLNFQVYEDGQQDATDILTLIIDDPIPSTGFDREVYSLRERSNSPEAFGDRFPSEDIDSPRLVNGGSFRSTVVLIVDADSEPTSLSNGNDVRVLTGSGEFVRAGGGNDEIKGKGGDDTLRGEGGDDKLWGGNGSDILLGEQGTDRLDGGEGNDVLNGGSGNDFLFGGNGSDVLDGFLGDDEMTGGEGNDLYIVDSLGDKIIDQRGTGRETVESSVNWKLGDGLDFLVLTGITAVRGIGNDRDNIIKGNTLDNVLRGKEGSDILIGNYGTDTLTGGSGDDRFAFYTTDLGEDGINLEGIDIIKDFNRAQGDKIQLFTDSFSGDISYDTTTGILSSNGFQFARLEGSPAFNASTDVVLIQN